MWELTKLGDILPQKRRFKTIMESHSKQTGSIRVSTERFFTKMKPKDLQNVLATAKDYNKINNKRKYVGNCQQKIIISANITIMQRSDISLCFNRLLRH